MPRITLNGDPGSVYTNDGPKVLYQFICSIHNTCGLCFQYHHAIGPAWPIPMHRGCRCMQRPVPPGHDALPYVDFREEIGKLDKVQQSRVVGRANLTLIERGVVGWDDVVTRTRVRDFHEVVALRKLGVDAMAKAGVSRRLAERAHATGHTPVHELAEQQRRRLIAVVLSKGVDRQALGKAVGEGIARRIGIGEGPSGPQRLSAKPGPKAPILPAVAKHLGIRSPAGPRVVFHGPVSDATREVAEELIAAMPEKVRTLLASSGHRFGIGHSLADVIPELSGIRPRGWPEGMTWDNADGLYHTAERAIVACQTRKEYPGGGVVESRRFAGVLRHETGHAIDVALDDISRSPGFRAAYAEDVGRMHEIVRRTCSYQLQGGDAGPEEAFAELFADEIGGAGSAAMDIRPFFPKATGFIRGFLE